MLHNTNEKLKRFLLILLLISVLMISCSCSLLTKPLDNRTGFSKYLTQAETNIRKEDWNQAKINLNDSKQAWKKIKPLLQIDIDHDYIKEIENDFIRLDGYLDTKDKSNSLVSILLLKDTWENISDL